MDRRQEEASHHTNVYTIERELSLEDIRERYDTLLRYNPDGIIEINPDFQIVRANPAATKIIGFSLEELLGVDVTELLSERQDLGLRYQNLSDIFRYVQTGEEILRKSDGSLIHVKWKSIPIFHRNRAQGAHIVLSDSTQSIQERDALISANTQLELIFDTVDISVWMQDYASRKVVQVSPKTEKIWGIPVETLAANSGAWYDVVHPDDVDMLWKKLQGLHEGKKVVQDYRVIHPNGSIHWVHDRMTPLPAADGKIDKIIGVAVDVTPLKKAQESRNRAHEALQRSEQLSVLGQLAAGIAHEIRNPLTSLKGFIQFLEPTLKAHTDYFDVLVSELNRINSIVSDFLMMAKPQPVQIELCEVTELIEEVVTLLEAQATLQSAHLTKSFHPKLHDVSCNKGQIKQVFINLLKNAMEAMPAGGQVSIETGVENEEEVFVRIADEGCGIPEELLPRIGESFFTTKEGGTGLGLMVSKEIVQAHGGRMVIDSEVGKGTTISVILPIAASND